MFDNLLLSRILDEDVAALKASGAFDEEWYVNEYLDVRQSGIDPARHYLWLGVRLGRKPSAGGQGAAPASAPARANVAAAAPVAQPVPVAEPAPPAAPPAPSAPSAPEENRDVGLIDKARKLFAPRRTKTGDSVYDLVAEHFDEEFYLTTYPDVAAAGIDPIRHYLDAGWHEQRDPSLLFSTRFYMDNNPDVVAAGVNPFFHFVAAGKAEGRHGKHQLGFRWDILARLKPVADQIAEMKSHRGPATISSYDPNWLASVIDSRSTYCRGRKGRLLKRISITPAPLTVAGTLARTLLAVVTITPVSTSTIETWNTGRSTAIAAV